MEVMKGIEERRDCASREEIVSRIGRAFKNDGQIEPIPGLHLYRVSRATERIHGTSKLALCVIAQGSKELTLGDSGYAYDADNYLLATVELPITGRIVDATQDRPYLSLRLDLDPALVGSVMVEAGLPHPQGHNDAKALVVSPLYAPSSREPSKGNRYEFVRISSPL